MIVAKGDPDLADCVAVCVAGIGAGLPTIGTLLDRGAVLHRRATSEAGTASVITWAGYDAPQSPAQTRSASPASRGAVALASFIAGLRVTARAGGTPITVIGHGYGGLLVGHALTKHELDIDAVVFLGCVSAGVDRASQLGFGGPVYATSPDLAGDGTPAGVHGPRPDLPAFGAQLLAPERPGGSDPEVPYLISLGRIIAGKTPG